MATGLSMRRILSSGLSRATIIKISILVLLSTIDYTLTGYAVNAGMGHEANPALSWLSLEGIGLVKTASILVLLYCYWDKPKIILMVASGMVLVVIWNIGCVV